MAEWSATTVWWLAAGALVAVELLSGSFYLLMLALGAALGALAGHAGLPVNGQIVVAALAGGGGVAVLHFRRRQTAGRVCGAAQAGLNLDIGATVQVLAWQADGSTRVQYRGAAWDALHQGSTAPAPGEHVISGLQGTRLLLTPRADS